MDFKMMSRRGRPFKRVPDAFIENYCSSDLVVVPNCAWLTSRFSPTDDGILFVGGDTGQIGVIDLTKREDNNLKECFLYNSPFSAAMGAIMDLAGVPGQSDQLLSISGQDVRLWHFDKGLSSSLYQGHTKSLRCAAFAPDSPNVFATGGRDGCVMLWDSRTSPVVRNNLKCHPPIKEFRNAHITKGVSLSRTPAKRRSEKIADPPSITSIAFANDYTIATASSLNKSGIRLWDTRKMPMRDESRPYAVFELPHNPLREAGIASFSLDRFSSSIFAASTDNCIYEFCINSSCYKPVRSYVGAAIEGDYYMQVACSPISDHVLCSSRDKRALMWDVQRLHSIGREASMDEHTGIQPSYSLGGHEDKVGSVGWSKNATYIVTMDEGNFRIWEQVPMSKFSLEMVKEKVNQAFQTIKKIEPKKVEAATAIIHSFSITPGPRLFLSPTKAGMAPLAKRKEPFASPFKPTCAVKLFRGDDNDQPSTSSQGENKENGEGRMMNPFYYKYPTMLLPNRVLERHTARLKNKKLGVATEETTKSGRKVRIEEWWTRDGGDRLSRIREPEAAIPASACSIMHNSPKKLIVEMKKAPNRQEPRTTTPARKPSASRKISDFFQKGK